MPLEPILQVEGFSKQFILHEQGKVIPSSQKVNLTVYPGRLTALVGPTGSGKSTVLNGIYRTYIPTAGRMLFRTRDGATVDLARADEHHILALRRAEIGFVTQFLRVLPRQATEDVVAQPLIRRGVDRQTARARAHEALRALSLPERLWGISPSTFSGGEKQRVNLARGLVARPRLLMLDEPTASLDPRITQRVVGLLKQLKDEGIAMLAILHDPDLVKRLADEVVELEPPSGLEQVLDEVATP